MVYNPFSGGDVEPINQNVLRNEATRSAQFRGGQILHGNTYLDDMRNRAYPIHRPTGFTSLAGGLQPSFGTGLGQLGLILQLLQMNPAIMNDQQYQQFQQRHMQEI